MNNLMSDEKNKDRLFIENNNKMHKRELES